MRYLLLFVILLAGCSAQALEEQEGLEVEIESNKETVTSLEPVEFKATVKFNGEPVDDADVQFELLKVDSYKIGKVRPDNNNDGTYSIETAFDERGTYEVIAHVTVDVFHEMPSVKVNLQ